LVVVLAPEQGQVQALVLVLGPVLGPHRLPPMTTPVP